MMKRHSLSNKVRNSILAAILLQSVVFGSGLGAVSYTHLDVYKRQVCNDWYMFCLGMAM